MGFGVEGGEIMVKVEVRGLRDLRYYLARLLVRVERAFVPFDYTERVVER